MALAGPSSACTHMDFLIAPSISVDCVLGTNWSQYLDVRNIYVNDDFKGHGQDTYLSLEPFCSNFTMEVLALRLIYPYEPCTPRAAGQNR